MTEWVFTNEPTVPITLGADLAIGASEVTLTASDGAKVPNPGTGQRFHICVYTSADFEWLVVTSRTSDVLTLASPATKAWDSGTRVDHRLHQDAIGNVLQKGAERTVTVNPNGSLAAAYTGEEVYNSVTGVFWKHCVDTVWKAMNL